MSEALADISKAGTPEKWKEAINQRPFIQKNWVGRVIENQTFYWDGLIIEIVQFF